MIHADKTETLKASELRLGNLLQDENSILMRVVGLCDFEVLRTPPIVLKAIDSEDLKEIGVTPGEPRPIPITKGWLISLGLEVVCHYKKRTKEETEKCIKLIEGGKPIPEREISNEFWFARLGYLRLHDYNRLGWTIVAGGHDEFVTCVKYVHQLQNFYFATFGKELAVKEPARP